jgi:hypothetical protein
VALGGSGGSRERGTVVLRFLRERATALLGVVCTLVVVAAVALGFASRAAATTVSHPYFGIYECMAVGQGADPCLFQAHGSRALYQRTPALWEDAQGDNAGDVAEEREEDHLADGCIRTCLLRRLVRAELGAPEGLHRDVPEEDASVD